MTTPEVDSIIEAAGNAAGEMWRAEALRVVEDLALTSSTFTADDVWEAGLEKPREGRALGAVMRQARSAGFLEPTDTYVPSRIRSNHSKPQRVWRSLVCVAAVEVAA